MIVRLKVNREANMILFPLRLSPCGRVIKRVKSLVLVRVLIEMHGSSKTRETEDGENTT